jgi:hypothetical protein
MALVTLGIGLYPSFFAFRDKLRRLNEEEVDRDERLELLLKFGRSVMTLLFFLVSVTVN